MYDVKYLKQRGLTNLPITVSVHFSAPIQIEANCNIILAFAALQTFTAPLRKSSQAALYTLAQSRQHYRSFYGHTHG